RAVFGRVCDAFSKQRQEFFLQGRKRPLLVLYEFAAPVGRRTALTAIPSQERSRLEPGAVGIHRVRARYHMEMDVIVERLTPDLAPGVRVSADGVEGRPEDQLAGVGGIAQRARAHAVARQKRLARGAIEDGERKAPRHELQDLGALLGISRGNGAGEAMLPRQVREPGV